MAKTLIIGEQARRAAVEALTLIADAVATTLGPAGLPAILDKPSVLSGEQYPVVTKDGVTLIENMDFVDSVTYAVWTFARAAANHSVIASGDGTTSTVVMAAAIARMVLNSPRGVPQAYAREVARVIDQCVEWVRQNTDMSPDLIRNVALTSANGDEEIADITMEALSQTSAYGTVLIEKNVMARERYAIVRQDGYEAGRGYRWHPTLALSCSNKTSENAPFEMENPYIWLYNGELNHIEQLEDTILSLSQKHHKCFSLMCLAFNVSDVVGDKLVEINASCPTMHIMACKLRRNAESTGQLQTMLDIAAISGAKLIDGGKYRITDDNTVEMLMSSIGTVKKALVTPYKTILMGRAPQNRIKQRIQENLNAMDFARCDVDKDNIAARNAELSEGLVQVIVGGGHMASIQERSDRLDDALKAAQAAKCAGVVAGCGATYIAAAQAVDAPAEVVDALRCIHRSILSNYGAEPNDRDFALGESQYIDQDGLHDCADFREANVCDAADTVCAVLKNGAELGLMCATTGCASLTTDLKAVQEMKMVKDIMGNK